MKNNELKLNITLKNGTELKNVYVFLDNKDLSNTTESNTSRINTKREFEKAMRQNKCIFYGGESIGAFFTLDVEKVKYLGCKLNIDNLELFERESEILAEEITKEIYTCQLIKGTWVQQIDRILEIINNYK